MITTGIAGPNTEGHGPAGIDRRKVGSTTPLHQGTTSTDRGAS